MKISQLHKISNLLVFTFCMLFPAFANAQDTLAVASNKHLADVQASRFTRELSLTGAQSREIYQILLKRIESIEQTYKANRLTDEQVKKINDASLKKVKAVLTAEQRELYSRITAELNAQKNARYSTGEDPDRQTLHDKMLNF